MREVESLSKALDDARIDVENLYNANKMLREEIGTMVKELVKGEV
jgi:hypothetical protein